MLLLVALASVSWPADGLVERYFAAKNGASRAGLALQIKRKVADSSKELSTMLHSAELWHPKKVGRQREVIELGGGSSMDVSVRVPKSYRPNRRWPLILALHPSGGDGPRMLDLVEDLLGSRAEEFIIAAPMGYYHMAIHVDGIDHEENPSWWREMKRRYHVDSDRVHVFGFSLGAITTWTWSALHADEFGGAVVHSGCLLPAELPGAKKLLLSNTQHLPIYNVWGKNDGSPVGTTYIRTQTLWGGFNGANRRMLAFSKQVAPLTVNREVPGRSHSPFPVPLSELMKPLLSKRAREPLSVSKNFRYLHQSSAYWIEGASWKTDPWPHDTWPAQPQRPGETPFQAQDRTVQAVLGHISATCRGNIIRIKTRHLTSVRLWLSEGLVRWDRPVRVVINGKDRFRGRVSPSIETALDRARTTYDFDRLAWVMLEVKC